MIPPDENLDWPIAYEMVCEIAKHEGCRLKAYRDVVGVWTIGWGETRGVTPNMVWTQQQADERFCASLSEFTEGVAKHCTNPPTEGELGAMVSLAYNIGLGGFAKSTVLRKHNQGDHQAAARAFSLWNKAGGNVVKGLTLRRLKEAAMYLSTDSDSVEPIPQRVDEESTLTTSPIAQSGGLSALGGVIAAATAVLEPVKKVAADFSIDPLLVLGAIAIVVGVVVLGQRNKQRNEGWA